MAISIQQNIPLAPYTTFGIGGAALHFCVVRTEEELQEAYVYAEEHGLEVLILGGGSNMLVSDNGVQALVVKIEIEGVTFEEKSDGSVIASVAAGESFDGFVAACVVRGYWGLENLSAIPGTVGATPVQNVGAYGVEVSDRISVVRVLNTTTREFEELSSEACAFAYRDSRFKREVGRYVVTRVDFTLSKLPKPLLEYKDLSEWFVGNASPSLQEVRDAVITIRSKKFPDWHVMGTAGSFFKNPTVTAAKFAQLRSRYPELPGYPTENEMIKVSLGYILDKILGLKGFTSGNVGTYEGQALVVVNHGNATSTEVENFAHMIAQKVFDVTHITIEWEVRHVQ